MWKEEIKTMNKGLVGRYTLLATFRVTPVHVFEQKQLGGILAVTLSFQNEA